MTRSQQRGHRVLRRLSHVAANPDLHVNFWSYKSVHTLCKENSPAPQQDRKIGQGLREGSCRPVSLMHHAGASQHRTPASSQAMTRVSWCAYLTSEHQNYRRKQHSWLIALVQSACKLQRRKESFICRISFKTEAQICQYILPRMVTQRCCLSEGTARRMTARSADFLFVRDKIKTLGKCGLLAIEVCMLFPELPRDQLWLFSWRKTEHVWLPELFKNLKRVSWNSCPPVIEGKKKRSIIVY